MHKAAPIPNIRPNWEDIPLHLATSIPDTTRTGKICTAPGNHAPQASRPSIKKKRPTNSSWRTHIFPKKNLSISTC